MENVTSRDPAQSSLSSASNASRRAEANSIQEPSLWQQNHGNLLIGFTAAICLVGITMISCQQSRFRPPSFPSNLTPDESAIAAPDVRPPNPEVNVLDLQIIGAASDDGVMRIAVYISPEGFNDARQAFEVDSWQIVNGVASGKWEVPKELKRLAIAAYHDVNQNGDLDRNALGIPSERYGFSADARGLTGPPPFDDAVITISDKPITISIR